MASDDVSLPRLPGVSWDEQTQSFTNNPRKRARIPRRQSGASLMSFNSSDPAVFSSDDDPGVDNYAEGGRRKKRYVGSWFQQQPASSSDSTFSEALVVQRNTKRTLARKLDSGVFLGSDSSGCEDMADFPDLEMPTRPKLPQLEQPIRIAPPRPSLSQAERRLQDMIRERIEAGEETVDFWSMDLAELSNETVSPLTQFACIPQVTKDVAFEQKDPELKLYLAQNRLNRLPGVLFDVEFLTTLSLRGNQLEEVPPAIGKLSNLQELNLSQNRLRHLPVEMLQLLNVDCKLRTLILHPNPFVRPNQGDEIFEILQEGDLAGYDDYDLDMEPEPSEFTHPPEVPADQLPRLMSRRLGRSPVQVSDGMGRLLSKFRLPATPTTEPLEVEVIYKKRIVSGGGIYETPPEKGPTGSLIPSLTETAMRSCSRSDILGEFKAMVPEEFGDIRRLFDRAVQQKDMGGLVCSRCARDVVVPAMEWIEWREVSTLSKFRKIRGKYRLDPLSEVEDELVVPFLHRACSRRCGPREENSGWEFPRGCQGMTVGYCLYNGPPVAEDR